MFISSIQEIYFGIVIEFPGVVFNKNEVVSMSNVVSTTSTPKQQAAILNRSLIDIITSPPHTPSHHHNKRQSPQQQQQHSLRDINLTCSLCHKYFYKPHLLNCLHTFCEDCLANNINHAIVPGCKGTQAIIKCMICDETTMFPEERPVTMLPYNFFANNAIDYLMIQSHQGGDTEDGNTILCTACSDNTSAISRCVECSEFLCMCCVSAHRRIRLTKDHKIIPLDTLRYDQSMVHRPVYCPTHKPEVFTYFCEVCQQLVCKECTILDHRGHKYERKSYDEYELLLLL